MTDRQAKASITKSEYYQLMGLLALAQGKDKEVQELGEYIRRLVGEKDELGHSSDAIYNGYTADELLNRLDIKIRKND